MKDMIDNTPMMMFGKLISRSTFGKTSTTDEEEYVFGLFELLVLVLYAVLFFYAVMMAVKRMDKLQSVMKKVIELTLAVTIPGIYVLMRGGP